MASEICISAHIGEECSKKFLEKPISNSSVYSNQRIWKQSTLESLSSYMGSFKNNMDMILLFLTTYTEPNKDIPRYYIDYYKMIHLEEGFSDI